MLNQFKPSSKLVFLPSALKWVAIASLIGVVAGSASALFLISLDWITTFRDNHRWVIIFLPFAGLLIGLMYYHFGKGIEGGNDRVFSEVVNPQKTIPLKMAPLVLLGTLITHFFGGSAGREGTAVQMGGCLADQVTRTLRISDIDRRIILVCGISAGFASVFGTPFTAIVFSLEVMFMGRLMYRSLIPSVISSFVANIVCDLWGAHHTSYKIDSFPSITLSIVIYCIAAGIIFGLVASFYTKLTNLISSFFERTISYPPLRPVIGGIFIAGATFMMASDKYNGLGVPTIVSSFKEPLPHYDFIIKIIFTSVTLGSGFKGGEVTPLFFIGATLGNALSLLLPLPIFLLAALGFVAVFSGAAKTPIACTILGMEIFGMDCAIYVAIACFVAYWCSGKIGIYRSQELLKSHHKRPF